MSDTTAGLRRKIGSAGDLQSGNFHRLRQSGIDAGLFDVISGFEALNGGMNSASSRSPSD